MNETTDYVSENTRMTGGFAIVACLMLLASTLGLGWISMGAVAGIPDTELMDGPGPEPAGGWGSGWINDTVIEALGVDAHSPSIATGPGQVLHATWHANAAVGGWNIYYSSSSDGGLTWTPQSLVAGTNDEERDPDIGVDVTTGRIFVTYERVIASPDSAIYCAWSDDGSIWNNVLVEDFGVAHAQVEPSIVVEHNYGLSYYVYIGFTHVVDPDNQNVFVYRSTDEGLTWNQMLAHGNVGDDNVYRDVELDYQQGADGINRLYAVYCMGVDDVDVYNIDMLWSEDAAVTWNGPYTVYNNAGTNLVEEPTMAASRDGDTVIVAWQRNDAGDYIIMYNTDSDPTTPDTGWGVGSIRAPTNNNGANDVKPKLATDGEGTSSTTLGGNYSLIWTTEGPEWVVKFNSRPTSLATGFVGADVITDTTQTASAAYERKGLTTQRRGTGWYPAVLWSDVRLPIYDIRYTTPGMRTIIKTNPTGRDFEVDAVTYTSPVYFIWPAGYSHSLNAPSPQPIGPTSQWTWVDWSDGGARAHTVTATGVDFNYTANFVVQHEVVINTSPVNLDIEVDLATVPTPANFWWDDGSVHQINAISPQSTLPGIRYVWNSWSDGMVQDHPITVSGPDTITAFYDRQFWVDILAWDTTNVVQLNGVEVTVDLVVLGNTPTGDWFTEGVNYNIGVEDPYSDGIDTYSFFDWSTGSANNPLIYSPLMVDTLIANYVQLPPDYYTFEITPATRTIAPGDSTTYTVTLTSMLGYTGDVTLTASALPAGLIPPATAVFAPNPVTVPSGGTVTSTLTIDNTLGVPDDTYTITVDGDDGSGGLWTNTTELIVATPVDYYTFEITPATRTIAPGDSTTYTVTLTSMLGYTGDVTLTASALPAGLIPPATAVFVPNPVTVPSGGTAVSILTIDNTAGVPDDTYTITVDGDDGSGGLWTNTTELVVATPTFDVTASPGFQMISPGQSATIDVTVTSVNNYVGNVDLTASAIPAGLLPPATATFVPATVAVPAGGSGTSTLTIANTGTVPDNTYTITIEGDDGAIIDTFPVDLQVSTVPFFTMDASPALRSISPGDSTTYTVTVTSVNSYVGNVDVSVSHAIPTTDATLSWDTTTLAIPDGGSETATLTVDTTGTIALQDFDLDFWADDGVNNLTEQTTLNLTAVVSGSISGTVTDQDGDPIDDATVELYLGTTLVEDTTTNNDGEYDFMNVGAGDYDVRASKDGYEDDETSVIVSAADPDHTDVDLQLDLSTYSIEGDLKDKDTDDRISGATVEVYDEDDDLVGSDTTLGNGHFEIDDLLPGTYKIVIKAEGYKTITLEDEEIDDDDVDLGDLFASPEEEPVDILGDYWWIFLLIIIIVIVVILIAVLAKRRKPKPEAAPPQYAEAQVPAQQPYQPPPEAPPEAWPTPPEEVPPEVPPPETPPPE